MKRAGFTFVELMVGMTIIGLLTVGTLTVFSESMKGFYKTKTDIDLASQNTLGVRRVVETLRSA